MSAARHIVVAVLAAAVAFAANPGTAAAQQAATITRRAWAGDSVELSGSPSPDERLISFVNPDGELAVRDLVTGRTRVLTHRRDSTEFALSSVFAPDSRKIAYTWLTADDTIVQLRVMALDSAVPRVIYQASARTAWLAPSDWTPDGLFVVTTGAGNDGHGQVMLVPAAGGVGRAITSFRTWRSAETVRVSPDGTWLAYDYPPREDEGRREIHIRSINDRRESIAVKNDKDSHLIGWTPDGSRIVFGREHDGAPSIWSLRIDAGEAKGSPTLIRGDMWRTNGLRLTPRGSLYYSVNTGDQDVLVASYDTLSGRLLSQTSLTQKQTGESYNMPSWSPDGRLITYVTLGTRGAGAVGANTVTIRSAEGAKISEFRPQVASLDRSVWTPDAKALVLRAVDVNGKNALFRLDLTTFDVAWMAPGTNVVPEFSSDGRWMYYVPTPAGQVEAAWRWRLVAHNLATGKELDLYVAPEGTQIAGRRPIVRSPDGQRIFFVTAPLAGRITTQIQTIDVRGGPPRPVPLQDPEAQGMRLPPNQNLVGISHDGRYVLFTTRRADDAPGRPSVWRVSIDGGKPEQIVREIRGVPRLSPDGRRLVYVAGGLSSELWVMEDPQLRSPAATNHR